MVMRFYWGLGVGHVYSHGDADIGTTNVAEDKSEDESGLSIEHATAITHNLNSSREKVQDHNHDKEQEGEQENSDLEEFGLDDRENDPWAGSDEDEGPEQETGGEVDDDDSLGGEEELELEYTYSGQYN